MKITLTKPPTLNKLYGINAQGRKYMTPEAMAWKNANGWILKATRIKLKGKIKLWITLFTSKHQDNDSILKVLLDTIQDSGMIEDDYWIFDLRVLKEIVELKKEKIEFEIEEIK